MIFASAGVNLTQQKQQIMKKAIQLFFRIFFLKCIYSVLFGIGL